MPEKQNISISRESMSDGTIYPALIMNALSTVRYPGTGKNIVEMHMVEDDLRIAGLHVSFTLIFDKPTDPFMKSVTKACEAAIHAYVHHDVEVEIATRALQAPPAPWRAKHHRRLQRQGWRG